MLDSGFSEAFLEYDLVQLVTMDPVRNFFDEVSFYGFLKDYHSLIENKNKNYR